MGKLGLVCLAVAFAFAGCGKHHGGGGDDVDGGGGIEGLQKIVVTPADQTLTVDGTTPATGSYTAMGEFLDGHVADITSLVGFELGDGTLGHFTGATLTTVADHGGHANVVASAGAVSGSTSLTLLMRTTINDPGSTGLPANPGGIFSAGPPDQNRAPQLVYPNDNVVVPPNLGKLEFHFKPGASNTLFELSFASSVLDVKVYLRCTTPLNGGCIYLPDPVLYGWIANSSRGTEKVTWSLRATDDTGTGVGSSAQMHVGFALADVSGGIYYWTTTTESIMRYDFAGSDAAATKLIDASFNGNCIGCHALSRDGTKLVAEVNGQNDGRTALIDIATLTAKNGALGSTPKTMFESWNPDGSQYVAVYGDNGATNYDLMLIDGNDGTLASTIPVGGTATNPTDHPDWSADGQRIAFVRVGIKGTMQRMNNGGIFTVAQAGATWTAPTALVPAENLKNHYYPAFAPDGRLLVYDESTCTSGNNNGTECNADTNPTATLFAIDSVAGGSPVALANANAGGVLDGTTTALTNSFPKWNPFIAPATAAGGHIAWITFSSKRAYGLRSGTPDNGTLLWMAAVDLDAPAGTDPSSVAFALPFQDYATSNHIAQWTTKVVPIQ